MELKLSWFELIELEGAGNELNEAPQNKIELRPACKHDEPRLQADAMAVPKGGSYQHQ